MRHCYAILVSFAWYFWSKWNLACLVIRIFFVNFYVAFPFRFALLVGTERKQNLLFVLCLGNFNLLFELLFLDWGPLGLNDYGLLFNFLFIVRFRHKYSELLSGNTIHRSCPPLVLSLSNYNRRVHQLMHSLPVLGIQFFVNFVRLRRIVLEHFRPERVYRICEVVFRDFVKSVRPDTISYQFRYWKLFILQRVFPSILKKVKIQTFIQLDWTLNWIAERFVHLSAAKHLEDSWTPVLALNLLDNFLNLSGFHIYFYWVVGYF